MKAAAETVAADAADAADAAAWEILKTLSHLKTLRWKTKPWAEEELETGRETEKESGCGCVAG